MYFDLYSKVYVTQIQVKNFVIFTCVLLCIAALFVLVHICGI